MSRGLSQAITENPISQAINEFGMNVLNAITAANDGNNIISPLSLSTALGMVHLGANGDTSNELRQVLRYNKYSLTDNEAHNAYKTLLQQIGCVKPRQYVLNVANRVMAQNDFDVLDDYSNQLQIYYNASIQSVDFAKNQQKEINTINEWVSDKTRGKIQSVFSAPIPAETRLVIVNAVYFKCQWVDEFRTMEDTFINNGNTKVTVQMMRRGSTTYNFTDSKELDADIVELPYVGGHINMYIILPHAINGLQKTSSALTEQKLYSAIKSMDSVRICLYLPKFKIEVSYSLVGQLQSVGLNNIFTDNADLSCINDHRDLLVSDVVHKVFLDIDEEGTDTMAITGTLCGSSNRPPPREFKVDHPFIVVIRDNRNDVNLFCGQITQL